jgi:hypothetical protein
MNIIPQVAKGINNIMTTTADKLARETGFVQRESKLTGSAFIQTLVFSWMSNPQATLNELTQTASSIGVEISNQGLEQRFTPEAGYFLEKVLSKAVTEMISSEGANIEIINRFNGVYLDDSTTVTLPDELSEIWEGCGGNKGKGVNCKFIEAKLKPLENNEKIYSSFSGQVFYIKEQKSIVIRFLPIIEHMFGIYFSTFWESAYVKGTSSSIKLQVRLNIKEGNLYGPILYDGRKNDRGTSLGINDLPKGSLLISDLGYFILAVLNEMNLKDLYWLCRLQAQTKIFDKIDKEWDVVDLLDKQGTDKVDIEIKIGSDYHIPCRLLAVRVPEKISNKRRRELHKEARRRGQAVSQRRLKMADWTIYITNAPVKLMNLEEAMVLYRVRWQIELLFKLWKSRGYIDEWRSLKPYRILCELYGKLIVMIIQHWLFLTSCWKNPDRSLMKAAKGIQKYALHLAVSCNSIVSLVKAIKDVQRCLTSGCKINRRRKEPATFQLLLSLEKGGGLG